MNLCFERSSPYFQMRLRHFPIAPSFLVWNTGYWSCLQDHWTLVSVPHIVWNTIDLVGYFLIIICLFFCSIVSTKSEKLLVPSIPKLMWMIIMSLASADRSLECFGVVTLELEVKDEIFCCIKIIDTIKVRDLLLCGFDYHIIVQCW